MLPLRPNFECYDKKLPPESIEALICLSECTFCVPCANKLQSICPKCGDELVKGPIRSTNKLGKYPAFIERDHKPMSCEKIV